MNLAVYGSITHILISVYTLHRSMKAFMSLEPVFVASELLSLPSVKLLVNVQIG